MEEVNNKKKGLLAIAIISGVIVLFLVIFFIIKILIAGKGQVSILVAPESAEIEIDGKVYKNGVYTFPAGKHFVSISAEGFSHVEFEFDLENGESFPLNDYLFEETKSYSEEDYEILSLIADDDITIGKVQKYRYAKTIENILPLIDSENNVFITNQSGNAECGEKTLCLGVSNLGNLTEESAISLVRRAGYDPSSYEILYEEGTRNYYVEAVE